MSKTFAIVCATALWLGTAQCCMMGYPLPKEGDGLKGKTDYVAQLGEFIEIEENLELTKVMSKYMNYGCFCGLGGMGNTPVDETDKCCKIHDHCFDVIEEEEREASPKFFEFLFSDDLKNWELIRLTYHYFYDEQNGNITCSNDQSAKQLEKCKCDKALAACLKTNVDSYNEAHLKMVKNKNTCPTAVE